MSNALLKTLGSFARTDGARLARSLRSRPALLLACMALPLTTGCNLRQIFGLDMYNQPKYKPMRASEFFEDRSSARPLVNGTVPRRDAAADRAGTSVEPIIYAGDAFPPDFPLGNADAMKDVLARGQLVYNVNCAVCHGQTGLGDGMIPQRGFPQPPSFVFPKNYSPDKFRSERDRLGPAERQRWDRTLFLNEQASPRHYVHAITNGWGAMFSYNDRVAEPDRWKVTAYIKALQANPPETGPRATHTDKPGAAQ